LKLKQNNNFINIYKSEKYIFIFSFYKSENQFLSGILNCQFTVCIPERMYRVSCHDVTLFLDLYPLQQANNLDAIHKLEIVALHLHATLGKKFFFNYGPIYIY